MVLFNFYIALFFLYISPQIIISYNFPKLKYSLVLIYSLIVSFSAIWILMFFSYFLDLPNSIIYIISIMVSIYSIYLLFINKYIVKPKYLIIWIIAFILLLPLFKNIPNGFLEWDAVVSWNRWGLELYNNEYNPIHAAYPLMIPSLYAIVYKIQGTNEIWWSAKIALSFLPLIALIFPLILYKESKNIIYLFISILIYPYLLMKVTIEGAVDMPVMIMGFLTLVTLLAADINRQNREFKYYLYTAILLSGISALTKQAGLPFYLFVIIYAIINLKYIENKKFLVFMFAISSLYFLSFLLLYHTKSFTGATGNLDLLIKLSEYTFTHKELLFKKFFMYPPYIPILEPLTSIIGIQAITPYLFIASFIIFILFFKKFSHKTLSILSLIFLLAGFFAWGKYASYHERNSYWVKTFLILFIAINLSSLLKWIKNKKVNYNYIYIILILSVAVATLFVKNSYANKIQKKFQTKLGWESIAKKIAIIDKNSQECVKVYTNNFITKYNYYARGLKHRFIEQELDTNFLHKALKNNCSGGSYFLFRVSTKSYDIWKKHISRLFYDKIIEPVDGSEYFCYIPPNTKIAKNYFLDSTLFANPKVDIIDNNVTFYIDSVDNLKDRYIIKGWAFANNYKIINKKYIILENKDRKYFIKTDVKFRFDVADKYKKDNLKRSGFYSIIYKKDIKEGVYNLSILVYDFNNKAHIANTNRKIRFKGQNNE